MTNCSISFEKALTHLRHSVAHPCGSPSSRCSSYQRVARVTCAPRFETPQISHDGSAKGAWIPEAAVPTRAMRLINLPRANGNGGGENPPPRDFVRARLGASQHERRACFRRVGCAGSGPFETVDAPTRRRRANDVEVLALEPKRDAPFANRVVGYAGSTRATSVELD